MGLSGCEKPHLILFFLRFHLSVHEGNLIIAEGVADRLIALFKRFQIKFLVFFDEWIDYIDLPSEAQLPSGCPDKVAKRFSS